MAGLHNTIASQIATTVAGVTSVQACSPTPVDSIPATPFGVVGPPKGQLFQPGSWERLLLQFPLRIYVSRIASADRDQTTTNDFLDNFLTAFRTGITLGGNVQQCVIVSWDTDRFYTVNNEDYQAIDFVLSVEVERSATYTA